MKVNKICLDYWFFFTVIIAVLIVVEQTIASPMTENKRKQSPVTGDQSERKVKSRKSTETNPEKDFPGSSSMKRRKSVIKGTKLDINRYPEPVSSSSVKERKEKSLKELHQSDFSIKELWNQKNREQNLKKLDYLYENGIFNDEDRETRTVHGASADKNLDADTENDEELIAHFLNSLQVVKKPAGANHDLSHGNPNVHADISVQDTDKAENLIETQEEQEASETIASTVHSTSNVMNEQQPTNAVTPDPMDMGESQDRIQSGSVPTRQGSKNTNNLEINDESSLGTEYHFVKTPSFCKQMMHEKKDQWKSIFITKRAFDECGIDIKGLDKLEKLVIKYDELDVNVKKNGDYDFYEYIQPDQNAPSSSSAILVLKRVNKLIRLWKTLEGVRNSNLKHLEVLDNHLAGVLHYMILDKHVDNRYEELVKVLDTNLVNVNQRDKKGNTPMHICMVPDTIVLPTDRKFVSSMECALLLKKYGGSFSNFNAIGLAPVHFAASIPNPFTMTSLLHNGADMNLHYVRGLDKRADEIVFHSIAKGPTPVIASMLDLGLLKDRSFGYNYKMIMVTFTNIHKFKTNFLKVAIKTSALNSKQTTFHYLVKTGADLTIEYESKNALFTAMCMKKFAEKYAVDLIELIADKSILQVPDFQGRLPLDYARGHSMSQVVQMIERYLEPHQQREPLQASLAVPQGVNPAHQRYLTFRNAPSQTIIVDQSPERTRHQIEQPNQREHGNQVNEETLKKTNGELAWALLSNMYDFLRYIYEDKLTQTEQNQCGDIIMKYAYDESKALKIISFVREHRFHDLSFDQQNELLENSINDSKFLAGAACIIVNDALKKKHISKQVELFEEEIKKLSPKQTFKMGSNSGTQTGQLRENVGNSPSSGENLSQSAPVFKDAGVYFSYDEQIRVEYMKKFKSIIDNLIADVSRNVIARVPGLSADERVSYISIAAVELTRHVPQGVTPQQQQERARYFLSLINYMPVVANTEAIQRSELKAPDYHMLMYAATVFQHTEILMALSQRTPSSVWMEVASISPKHGIVPKREHMASFLSKYKSLSVDEDTFHTKCLLLRRSQWILQHVEMIKLPIHLSVYCTLGLAKNAKTVILTDAPSHESVRDHEFKKVAKKLFPNAETLQIIYNH